MAGRVMIRVEKSNRSRLTLRRFRTSSSSSATRIRSWSWPPRTLCGGTESEAREPGSQSGGAQGVASPPPAPTFSIVLLITACSCSARCWWLGSEPCNAQRSASAARAARHVGGGCLTPADRRGDWGVEPDVSVEAAGSNPHAPVCSLRQDSARQGSGAETHGDQGQAAARDRPAGQPVPPVPDPAKRLAAIAGGRRSVSCWVASGHAAPASRRVIMA